MMIGAIVVLDGLVAASIRSERVEGASAGAGASAVTTAAPRSYGPATTATPRPAVPATAPPRTLFVDQRELIVYMQPSATDAQGDAVRRRLERMTDLQSIRFVDKQEAYEEMKVYFAEHPDVLSSVSVEDAPVNFHVLPKANVDRHVVGARLANYKGILNVAYPDFTGPPPPVSFPPFK